MFAIINVDPLSEHTVLGTEPILCSEVMHCNILSSALLYLLALIGACAAYGAETFPSQETCVELQLLFII